MNKLTEAIRKELASCSDLLSLFQQERQLYCSNLSIGIAEVTSILKNKQQIVEIFDRQHLLMKNLREDGSKCSDDEQAEHKVLMRRLGSILEQLLVIDHENEKLLRENISSRRVGPAASVPQTTPNVRMRPSLQRQMPFIPGMRQAAATTIPATEPAVATPSKIRTAAPSAITMEKTAETVAPIAEKQERTSAKHLLRRYMQGGSELSSKYA